MISCNHHGNHVKQWSALPFAVFILALSVFCPVANASLSDCVRSCLHIWDSSPGTCGSVAAYPQPQPQAAVATVALTMNLDSSESTYVPQFRTMITGLRKGFKNSAKPSIQVTFTSSQRSFVLFYDWSDLYVRSARVNNVGQPVPTMYADRSRSLVVTKELIRAAVSNLARDIQNFGTADRMSEHFRLVVGLSAEAARFGIIRYSFGEKLGSSTKKFDLASCAAQLGDWSRYSQMAYPGPRNTVGLDDPCLNLGGTGHSFGQLVPVCGLAPKGGSC